MLARNASSRLARAALVVIATLALTLGLASAPAGASEAALRGTTIGLYVTKSSFVAGTPSSAKVTIRDSAGRPGAGSIQYFVDGGLYKWVQLNSVGQSSVRLSAATGRHRVTAKFIPRSGSGQKGSADKVGELFTITPRKATSVSLTVTATSFTAGSGARVRAAVKSSTGRAGRGEVQFIVNGKIYRWVDLNHQGVASVALVQKKAGTYTVKARFLPSATGGHKGSSSTTKKFTVTAPAVVRGTPAYYKNSANWSANWNGIAQCESGQNWSINTGNGYYGGLQFNYATWLGAGGGHYANRADLATKWEQITIAERLHASRGLSPWACAWAG